MQKTMQPLKVATTEDGAVDISQRFGYHDEEEQSVRIDYAQIDVLIQWLTEAKQELAEYMEDPKPVKVGK